MFDIEPALKTLDAALDLALLLFVVDWLDRGFEGSWCQVVVGCFFAGRKERV